MGASTDMKSEYSVDTITAVCTSNLIKVELHEVHFKCKEAESVANLVKAIHHSKHTTAAAAAAESSVKMQNPHVGPQRLSYKETLISMFMMIHTFLEHKVSLYADDPSTALPQMLQTFGSDFQVFYMQTIQGYSSYKGSY